MKRSKHSFKSIASILQKLHRLMRRLLGNISDSIAMKNYNHIVALRLSEKSLDYIYGWQAFDQVFPFSPRSNLDSSLTKPHTRSCPSPFYSLLLNKYKQIHSHNSRTADNSSRLFNGSILASYIKELKKVIVDQDCMTMLDYGAGKKDKLFEDEVIRQLALTVFTQYEPGVNGSSQVPGLQHDLVGCFDVLEHIHISDLFWVIDELFHLAKKCVFVSVSSRIAYASFADGQQVHITLRPPEWWAGAFEAIASRYPSIEYVLCVEGPNSKALIARTWFSRNDATTQLFSSLYTIT